MLAEYQRGLNRKEAAFRPQPKESLTELDDLKYAIDQAAIVTSSDIRGEIIYANDLALKLYGYSREELIGKNHRILNSGVHPKEFFRNLWETVLSGKVWRGEICNKSKDGSLHWLDTTIVPFHGESGYLYKFMSIRKDITAKKRMEEDLEHEQRKQSALERLSAVGEVAANIAHEIKNPLTAIQLQAQLLCRRGRAGTLAPDAAADGAEKIISVTRKIEKIITGLLSLSRNADSDPLETVNVLCLIEDTLEFCSANLEKRGIQIVRENYHEKFIVQCRPIQISQVLLNLINNARDAVESLEERWIKIGVHSSGGFIKIEITDSGTSLTPKIRSRLMEPFFTTKKNGKGTGLGLSISRKILESHRGSLRIADSKNTCFVISLPQFTHS